MKGVDLLIRAIHCLEKHENIECLIIGDGPESEALKVLAKRLCLECKVSFLGAQFNIPEWLWKASVFVHPAIYEEGFGISIVEAMAAGLPCIGFRQGAIEEIIEDRINGFIVSQMDHVGLMRAIEQAREIKENNPDAWSSLIENAGKTAQKFQIFTMVKRLDQLIQEES